MIVFTLSQIICDILDKILIILLPRSSDAPGLLLQKAVPSDIKSDAGVKGLEPSILAETGHCICRYATPPPYF